MKQSTTTEDKTATESLYRKAYILAVITILYNLLEGGVSTALGLGDESLALFGFGMDSFIEVISGVGILHMVRRIQNNPNSSKDKFEQTALKITGTAFYLLSAGLVLGAILKIWSGSAPDSTFWGIVISILSLITMIILYKMKLTTGKALNSKPIIADANCTKVCLYMSIILLVSSLLYHYFGIQYIDSIGAIGLAYYSIKEGKESFDKSKGIECDDCC